MKPYQHHQPKDEEEVYSPFTKRTIRVGSSCNVLSNRFETQQEEDEFHRAIGKLVTQGYGQGPREDDQVVIHLATDLSMTVVYLTDEKFPERKSVMAAIPTQVGDNFEELKYSFHT